MKTKKNFLCTIQRRLLEQKENGIRESISQDEKSEADEKSTKDKLKKNYLK